MEDWDRIALQYSECTSAAKGGDLGMFGPGMMQKAFEDASYATPVGEISDLVDSDSGIHIILRLQWITNFSFNRLNLINYSKKFAAFAAADTALLTKKSKTSFALSLAMTTHIYSTFCAKVLAWSAHWMFTCTTHSNYRLATNFLHSASTSFTCISCRWKLLTVCEIILIHALPLSVWSFLFLLYLWALIELYWCRCVLTSSHKSAYVAHYTFSLWSKNLITSFLNLVTESTLNFKTFLIINTILHLGFSKVLLNLKILFNLCNSTLFLRIYEVELV